MAAAESPPFPITRGLPAGHGLEFGDTVRIVAITDGDTVRLDNGREVRLTGVQAPKLALGRAHFEDWPLAGQARSALADLARDRAARLAYGGNRQDRHGRILAHVILVPATGSDAGPEPGPDAGIWLQGTLLASGLARVYTFADNRALTARMLELEAEARRARRGIWNHPFYRIRTPTDTHGLIDSFQIVEGAVRRAARIRNGRVFLNFGADWKTDFTISIPRAAVDLDPRDLLGLSGRQVQVRGWIEDINGPSIEIDHPEQLRILDW